MELVLLALCFVRSASVEACYLFHTLRMIYGNERFSIVQPTTNILQKNKLIVSHAFMEEETL